MSDNMNYDQTAGGRGGDDNDSNGVPNAAEAALRSVEKPKQFEIPPHPSTPEEEKALIKELETKANDEGLKLGATWYVVSSKWSKQWKEYVQYEWYSTYMSGSRNKPGPIDNTSIIEEGSPGEATTEIKVKKTAMENYDYVIVSEEIWLTLHSWYGGGPPLPRKVIATGWDGSNRVVEVRPLTLKVVKSSAMTDIVIATFSKSDSVGNLKKTMCERMGLRVDDVRIWDYHAFSKYKLLENMDQKLDAAQIIDGQPILLEEKDENGKFPEIQKSRSTYSSSTYSYYSSTSGGPTDPGTTGLINLGNTCFMNSSLQCLSNTPPLSEFFTSNRYKADINTDNPLGTKGELAEEYASLIKELWSGNHSAVAPRDFKYKLERFAPAFAGYQQHDAQELLSFLLDGLHEDLNRVKRKPYRDRPETQEQGESKFSEDLWQYHKERNDSIIVDWFQGQLKSTLVCPKCNRVSITFDPMMYLSLPLPMKMDRIVYLTFFSADARKPTRYGVTVNKMGTIGDLKQVLGDMTGTKADSIVISDVYNGRFFKIFQDKEGVDAIQERDFICAYELAGTDQDLHLPIVMRKDEAVNYSNYSMGNYTRKSLFSVPFIVSVSPKGLTYKKLYELVYARIQRFLKGNPPSSTTTSTMEEDSSSEEETPEKAQKQRKSNRNGSGSDTESDEEDEEIQEQKKKKKRKSQPLFVLKLVDPYGLTDQDTLDDDDKPLDLKERQTVAVCWEEDMLEYYDESKEKDVEQHESSKKTAEKEMEDSVPLSQCIDLFTETEQLGPEDAWYCSTCKEHVQATKKFDLWRLPPILVIHLKRFSYKKRYWREKLETFVDYPITDLDLSAYVKGPQVVPPMYDLYAVSNHFGSLGGGHYTAYGKNKNDSKWYKFDDSSVSRMEDGRVKTSSAYVLFYRRKDTYASPTTTTITTATSNSNSKDEEDSSDSDAMEQESTSSRSTTGVRESTDQDPMEEVKL